MLAERVSAGQLPPVEERLPANPMVVTPVEEVGQYGGTWHKVYAGNAPWMGLASRYGYDSLVRFDTDGTTYGTGLQGIADRLAAIGGELSVTSAPGKGTTVAGTVPA